MTEAVQLPEIPRRKPIRHANILFDERQIPAALADDLLVYVPVSVICEQLGIDAESQTERIREHRALRAGMAVVQFPVEHGSGTRQAWMNAISLLRLHAWLFTIPPERLGSETARETLYEMQEHLADVIYAWMARPGVPEDLRAEQESRLPETQQDLLNTVGQAREAFDLAQLAHKRVDAINERLEKLESQFVSDVAEFISPQQRTQYRSWIKVIGELLIKKGDGDYGHVEAELKNQFGFTSYKLIEIQDFPRIRAYCQQWFRRLTPAGTPLPQVLTDPDQQKLF